jgi:hypothetical protein
MANTETTIKVFRLDDCTWWAGADLESCIADAMREYQLPRQDVANADAHELSDEELDRLNFVDGDDPINTDGTTGVTLTFRQALARCVARGDSFPQFFASTEY